jgi:hypothetical protein
MIFMFQFPRKQYSQVPEYKHNRPVQIIYKELLNGGIQRDSKGEVVQ